MGVILALPKISEGARVNANAFEVLNEVYGAVESGLVSPLIVVDNEKINKLYPVSRIPCPQSPVVSE